MPLLTLPSDVIERVVFWSASINYLHPPKEIISIVSTCREFHDIVLGTPEHPNYAVLADISRFRFSTAAPRRRLGPIATINRNLSMELTIRVPTLRRVRQCDTESPHVTADLWVVYHMCIEDDGCNIEQLDHAQAERWVSQIILELPRDDNSWPVQNEMAQLAVAVYSLLAPRSSTVDQGDPEVLSVFYDYAFGSQVVSIFSFFSASPLTCPLV